MNYPKQILKLAGVLILLAALTLSDLTCMPSWSTQYSEFWKTAAETKPVLFYSAGAAAALIFAVKSTKANQDPE